MSSVIMTDKLTHVMMMSSISLAMKMTNMEMKIAKWMKMTKMRKQIIMDIIPIFLIMSVILKQVKSQNK